VENETGMSETAKWGGKAMPTLRRERCQRVGRRESDGYGQTVELVKLSKLRKGDSQDFNTLAEPR